MSVEKLLEFIKKTNPGMTRNKLIDELSKCRYSATAIIITCKNSKKSAQNE